MRITALGEATGHRMTSHRGAHNCPRVPKLPCTHRFCPYDCNSDSVQCLNYTGAFGRAYFLGVGGMRYCTHAPAYVQKNTISTFQFIRSIFSPGQQRNRNIIHHCNVFFNRSPQREGSGLLLCQTDQTEDASHHNYKHAHSLKRRSYGKQSKITFPTAALNTTPNAGCTQSSGGKVAMQIHHHIVDCASNCVNTSKYRIETQVPQILFS